MSAADQKVSSTAKTSTSPVLAVVLNWNGGQQTRTCLERLASQTPEAPDILVVDNASTDDSLDDLRSSGIPHSLRRLDANAGFAGGMNVGMQQAMDQGYRFVWLVNNDAFPESDCLATLVGSLLADISLSLVTPRLMSRDGSEQAAGGLVNWYTGELKLLSSGDLAADRVASLPDGVWITGTAPLIRTSALKQTGLFEPSFFAYWEDVDLSVRLSRAGGRLAAVPSALTVHLGGGTSGGEKSPLVGFLDTRNRWLFLERHARVGSSRVRWWRYAASALRRAARCDMRGHSELGAAVLAGVSAARRHTPFRPGMSLVPRFPERMWRSAPWRLSELMMDGADWLEPDSRPVPRFPFDT